MFNDRDLTILGAGALAAVFCLFLPLEFAAKIVIGTIVLALFMALALVRFGRDRVPLEVWIKRRIKYAMTPRQHVYHQPGSSAAPAPIAAPQAVRPAPNKPEADYSDFRPVSAAWEEVGVYQLMTVFLMVVGAYFVYWLANGGSRELARLFT